MRELFQDILINLLSEAVWMAGGLLLAYFSLLKKSSAVSYEDTLLKKILSGSSPVRIRTGLPGKASVR